MTDSVLLILQKSGRSLLSLTPYALLGAAVGEALRFTSWTRAMRNAAAKSPALSIIAAALLGMASPLCTYGTVPVVLHLFRTGVGLAPLATFLSTSSLMNPQLFIITWGGLGPEMALVRAGAVLLFGLLMGLILNRLPQTLVVNPNAGGEGSAEAAAGGRPRSFDWKDYGRNLGKSLQYVGFYLVVGIVLGAAVEVFLPAQWIAFMFRPGRWLSVFLAALLGMPLYACGGGTIPLIQSFIRQGMSKGAALAFFLVGPATRVTPLLALASFLRPLFITAHVLSLLVFSVLVGIAYR